MDAFVASNRRPESYRELIALLEAKLGYWDAYQGYLGRLIAQTVAIAERLEEEID